MNKIIVKRNRELGTYTIIIYSFEGNGTEIIMKDSDYEMFIKVLQTAKGAEFPLYIVVD